MITRRVALVRGTRQAVGSDLLTSLHWPLLGPEHDQVSERTGAGYNPRLPENKRSTHLDLISNLVDEKLRDHLLLGQSVLSVRKIRGIWVSIWAAIHNPGTHHSGRLRFSRLRSSRPGETYEYLLGSTGAALGMPVNAGPPECDSRSGGEK